MIRRQIGGHVDMEDVDWGGGGKVKGGVIDTVSAGVYLCVLPVSPRRSVFDVDSVVHDVGSGAGL